MNDREYYEIMKNKGYEVKFYYRDGSTKRIVGCKDLDEVAMILIRFCNGGVRGNFPTIWLDGVLIR